MDDTKINLDITAMIAYVSAMTNGRYLWKLKKLIEKSDLTFISAQVFVVSGLK